MKVLLRTLVLTLLAGSTFAQDAAPAGAGPQMLKLRSGGILWGSIENHDPELLSFRRLDNGGLVHLPWAGLDPREELELRTRFGYIDVDSEELLVDADKLTLRDGQELVGLIVNRTEDSLWLKRADGQVPVPKIRLAGASTVVQVPALDVYTKEQLYQKRLLELQDRLDEDDPAAHFELARYCERFFDYAHAAEHYASVKAIDPTHEADTVPAALERTEAKALLQGQIDALAEIDRWRAKKLYHKAIEQLNAFPVQFPDSPLMEDWAKLRDRINKYQLRDLRREVVRRWHYWTDRHAAAGARLEGFEAVMGYLEEKMEQDVLKSVVEDLKRIAPEIKPDEARRLWEEREGGRVKQASFGIGTWLLGESDALKEYGNEDEKAKPSGGNGKSEELADLQKRLDRYLKNQELARKAQTGSEDDADPEEFWRSWNYAGRRAWVKAWFVENSGLYKVEQARFTNCQTCGGRGVRTVVFSGGAIAGQDGGSGLVPCPTCHQIGRVRRIRYR
jgi:hypothetical protein